MSQINFRVKDDEKQVIQALADQRGISVAEFAKLALMKEITPVRVEIAFQLLKEGKIGRKRALTLSGLSYHEFMLEWTRRGAAEVISEEADARGLEIAYKIDLRSLRLHLPPSPKNDA